METLLWRWSTAVQVTSALMIAVFFVALSRRARRPEVRLWTGAWLANFAALAVAVVFWFKTPSGLLLPIARGAYLGPKLLWLLLLVEGARAVRRPGDALLSARQRWTIVAVYTVAGGLLLQTIPLLGLVQHSIIAIVLLVAAMMALRVGDLRWLVMAFVVRGAVAGLEAAAYAVRDAKGAVTPVVDRIAGLMVATSSSFDTGAEWLLVLASVLVVSQRVQDELARSNRDLMAAHDELRTLADHDPLTGLENRRSLQARMGGVQPSGAMLLFFDLNGFKEINDVHGHTVGDECLKRFAAALRTSFRPDDVVVRYAGDEFLVIARGLESSLLDERLAILRQRLDGPDNVTPPIGFSVGVADLDAEGGLEAAVRRADEAMYRSKVVRRASA